MSPPIPIAPPPEKRVFVAYLDHNATSPLRPEVRAALERALALGANPSSIHAGGRASRATIERAREQVADATGVQADEVIFTSGGTEANALALHGAIEGAADRGEQITQLFVSAIEHDSVLATAEAIAQCTSGLRLQFIPIDGNGAADLDALRGMLREGRGRALIALMAANNETGVVQPVVEAAAIARAAGALLFIDAVQAFGKMPLPEADYLSLSAHKIGGPQGTGALIVRHDAPLLHQLVGGGQERGLRAGTENVAGIAGFGAAAEAAAPIDSSLRDRFETQLRACAPDVAIFGANAERLSNTSNFALPGIAAETAIISLDLDGVMVSSGAACSSGKVRPSRVLKAMGVPDEIARCALRASFGWNSVEDDVNAAIAAIAQLLARAPAREAA